jgi:lipid II isoglutaminyl synthase (glutamine-hydrolysing)
MTYSLTLMHLYPKHLSLYGDRGNVLALKQRLAWRGMSLTLIEVNIDTLGTAALAEADLYFMGGGQDTQQHQIIDDLHRNKASFLREAHEAGALFLTICGGYQLLGHYYKPHQGDELRGLSLLDAYTVAGTKRLIGNVVGTVLNPALQNAQQTTLVGFENHSGCTYLGEGVKPLVKLLKGHGNNATDGFEGAWHKNLIGTYLHGPLLPKNPALTDAILCQALERRYGSAARDHFHQLDDYWEQKAHWQAKNLVLGL